MKVADSLKTLRFESVKKVCEGIETVMQNFPPAVSFLNELTVQRSGIDGIMTTTRQRGGISFSPEYFSNEAKMLDAIKAGVKTGYYPPKTGLKGIGAHEAGHIIEDWLMAQYGIKDVGSRTMARKITCDAYKRAVKTPEGKGKSVSRLKIGISNYANEGSLSECLAEALSDYITNGKDAAVLSREIWQVLKEESEKCLHREL